MAAEAPVTDLYDEQGRSRFLHSPVKTSHPLSNDHSLRPLWLGTLSDLVLIENPIGQMLPDGHEKNKTLEKYIRLSWGPNETPVYIVDNHEVALYCWYEAFFEGRVALGATLLHYDDHSDAEKASQRAPVISPEALRDGAWSLDDAVETVKKLGCWEFIEPAQRSGLVDQFIYITPGNTLYSQYYSANDHHTSRTEMSIEQYDESREKELQNTIVDIDLDFFASKKLNTAAEERYMQIMRQDIASAGVVTFATSPGFIDAERAISIVKKILC